MSPSPYAHTRPGYPHSQWEPLFTPFGEINPTDPSRACSGQGDSPCAHCESLAPNHGHLNKVAWWCAKFAGEMFPPDPDREAARQWGYLAGLWHDLGKFAPEWQTYLKSKADPHEADVSGKLDHATAGAQYAVRSHPLLGHLLAYPMACHHSGLLDSASNNACLAARLKKSDLPEIPEIPVDIPKKTFPQLSPFLAQGRDPFSISFFTRMLFSCLVDADFLATEAFMSPDKTISRNQIPENILEQISSLVDAKIASFGPPSPNDQVAIQRNIVVENCRSAASGKPGIFTLTVPTGGGKTLSSLSFALRHALAVICGNSPNTVC